MFEMLSPIKEAIAKKVTKELGESQVIQRVSQNVDGTNLDGTDYIVMTMNYGFGTVRLMHTTFLWKTVKDVEKIALEETDRLIADLMARHAEGR